MGRILLSLHRRPRWGHSGAGRSGAKSERAAARGAVFVGVYRPAGCQHDRGKSGYLVKLKHHFRVKYSVKRDQENDVMSSAHHYWWASSAIAYFCIAVVELIIVLSFGEDPCWNYEVVGRSNFGREIFGILVCADDLSVDFTKNEYLRTNSYVNLINILLINFGMAWCLHLKEYRVIVLSSLFMAASICLLLGGTVGAMSLFNGIAAVTYFTGSADRSKRNWKLALPAAVLAFLVMSVNLWVHGYDRAPFALPATISSLAYLANLSIISFALYGWKLSAGTDAK